MKNQIKYLQNLFYDLLNDYGRAFVVVKYSDRTIIGNRGFTDEEKEKGLILLFNNRIENCFIHHEDIIAVFSPEAGVKFDRWDVQEAKDAPEVSELPKETERERPAEERIISLDDFRKKMI